MLMQTTTTLLPQWTTGLVKSLAPVPAQLTSTETVPLRWVTF